MNPRDTRLDTDYWAQQVAGYESFLTQLRAQVAHGGTQQQRAVWFTALGTTSQHLAIALYSQGQPLERVRSQVATAQNDLLSAIEEVPEESFDIRGLADYTSALWLLSLGYCLALGDDQQRRFVMGVGNRATDQLYEALIDATLGESRPAERLVRPRPYATLLSAFGAPAAERPLLVAAYLKAYYPQMRGTYWWGAHNRAPVLGYFGYWCFEAAAIVRLLNIDDHGFADDPYYPGDLVAAA